MSGEFVVSVSEPEFQIISEAPQGMPGPRGLPGNSGAARTVTAGESAVAEFRAVAWGVSGVVHADASLAQHIGRVFGVSSSYAGSGDELGVVTNDELQNPAWAWDMNAPVWLGMDGRLTQIVPASGHATFSQVVGYPTATDRVFIQIGLPIVLTQ